MKENERGREGDPGQSPEAERERNHPEPRLEISTRTVSECQASGADKAFLSQIDVKQGYNIFPDYHS